MSLQHRARQLERVLRQEGLRGFFYALLSPQGRPIPGRETPLWKEATKEEIAFWEAWFRTKGLTWPEDYRLRFDPDRVLQPTVAALLPPQSNVHILDVGAGPLTCLGKKLPGKEIEITAIDALADEWDRLFEKHHVEPLVRSQKLAAEELAQRFPANTFDLVYAQNSIDHCYDPERAIVHMIDVAKSGCYIYLSHYQDEGEHHGWTGLHQWNLSMSAEGAFLIGSKHSLVNMTEKYADICRIECEATPGERVWLQVRILKH